MSSILDALKKAERESLEGDGKDSPWPVPAVDRSAKSKYRRRLTIPLGVIVGLLLMVSLYWTTRQPAPDPRQSVDSKPAMEPVPFENTRSASLPLPKAPPLTHREGAATPPASPPAGLSQNRPMPEETAERPDPAPQQSLSQPEKKTGPTTRGETPEVEPLPAEPPAAPPVRQPPMEIEKASPPPAVIPEEARQASPKVFRTDARIDLQALVWAPEAVDRFVVINNILVKEGGSIDTITVVRINPDDVLLSEGADQWHQEFKIR